MVKLLIPQLSFEGSGKSHFIGLSYDLTTIQRLFVHGTFLLQLHSMRLWILVTLLRELCMVLLPNLHVQLETLRMDWEAFGILTR